MANRKSRNSRGNSSMRREEMSNRRKPRTVYIDCSVTFYTGLNTGIQRVVRNIICRSDYLSGIFNVPCVPVVFAFGRAWTIRYLTSPQSLDIKKRNDSVMKSSLNSFAGQIKTIIPEGKFKSRLRNIYWKLAQVVSTLLFNMLRPVSISRGDLLLAVDAFWTHNIIAHLENLSRRGVSVITVIYDLFPITHPEYVDDNNVRAFYANIDRVLSMSDGVIGISKATRSAVMDYMKKMDGKARKDTVLDYFYLGSDLGREGGTKKKVANIRKWPDGLWKTGEVYLMVGTIEPRKGYDFALNAFEKMWSEGSGARLLIVGRIGWKCSDLMDRFNNSPYRDSRLFVFHDTNDEELLYCYSQATALICASRNEGFGLPLVEAMGMGLSVVASDIPIFREIGGNYPIYFSLDSINSLTESLRSASKIKTGRREWISWDESAVSLTKKALSIYADKMKALDFSNT